MQNSNYSKINEFARKKSIIIKAHIWHQKLPFIIFVANRNFIFINISIKIPFRAKTLVPYESRKREKIHISYIVHPRKISLTESMGSRSFFILKSGVHFSFWADLNFSYLLRPTSSEFYRKGRLCKILIFNFFQPLLGLVSSPHSLFSVHSPQSQSYFHPAVGDAYLNNSQECSSKEDEDGTNDDENAMRITGPSLVPRCADIVPMRMVSISSSTKAATTNYTPRPR